MIYFVMAWAGAMWLSSIMNLNWDLFMLRNAWTAPVLLGALLLAKTKCDIRPYVTSLLVIVWAWAMYDYYYWQVMRVNGPMPHPNDLVIAPILGALSYGWAWPFAIVTAIFSGSRNAILGCTLGIFLLVDRRWKCVMALVGFVIVCYLSYTNADFFTRGTGRIGQWVVAWEMFLTSPVWGLGPGSFVDHYGKILESVELPFYAPTDYTYMPWAHNIVMEQLGERGLLGLIAFVIPLVVAVQRANVNVRSALIVFLIVGMFDLTFLKPWVVGSFWSLVALSERG